MISIEAWRSAIGSYNKCKTQCNVTKTNNIANSINYVFLVSTVTVMTAALINTLLIIGCIESNPGPKQGAHEGKCY